MINWEELLMIRCHRFTFFISDSGRRERGRGRRRGGRKRSRRKSRGGKQSDEPLIAAPTHVTTVYCHDERLGLESRGGA